ADPAEEPLEHHDEQERRRHRDERDPRIAGPVGVGHHIGQAETDQHDDPTGHHGREDPVDDPYAQTVDGDADQGQHHTGHQDRTGHHGIAVLGGADGDHTADERRAGAEIAGHLALHDQQ